MEQIITKRLLNDVSWQAELDAMKSFICSEVQFEGVRVPRFGVHSIYAKNMPFFAYDDPYMLQRFGETAFTDSIHCFFSVPFLKKIMEDPNGANGLIFLALHEISHPLYLHFSRNLNVSNRIANIAQDYSINTRLLRDYVKNEHNQLNSLSPLPPALAVGVGFNDGDIEKYSKRSEEDIARELVEEEKNAPKNSGNGNGKQSSMPGQGQGGSPQSGDGSAEGMGTEHRVSIDEMIDALQEAGLGHIVDLLKMPKTQEQKDEKAENQKADVVNAVNKMSNIRAQVGDRMPGAHCFDSAKELVGALAKPKITWKLAMKNAIFGNGMKFTQSFDHAADVYHFDLKNVGLPDRIYDGAHIPSKPSGFVIALLDTSGSMSLQTDINTAVSEIFGLVQGNKSSAPDVVLLCADTVGRGDPIVITPANADRIIREQVAIDGRGGTDLTSGIVTALEHPEVKRRLKNGQKINSMLYFTDLGDTPPVKADLPPNLPKKFFYMAVPGTYNDQFAKQVSDYATTVSMGEKMEVDLDTSVVQKRKKKSF